MFVGVGVCGWEGGRLRGAGVCVCVRVGGWRGLVMPKMYCEFSYMYSGQLIHSYPSLIGNGGFEGLILYERHIARTVIAYLRLIVNSRDDLALMRTFDTPSRGVGVGGLTELKRYCNNFFLYIHYMIVLSFILIPK